MVLRVAEYNLIKINSTHLLPVELILIRLGGVSLYWYSERKGYHFIGTQRGRGITLLVLGEVGVSLYLYSDRQWYHFICTQRGGSVTLLVLR